MISILNSLPPLAPYVITILALLVLLEQTSYLRKRRHVPGPMAVLPFLGNAMHLVTDPASFWDKQARLANSSSCGLSTNYVVGRFILFIRDTELSHKIFANVRPDGFQLMGHPFGKQLFGQHNMIFMFGQEHKDRRRRITPNFTLKALSTYTALQQITILKHLEKWVGLSPAMAPEPVALRPLVRELNLETSQTVFVGPYLSPAGREQFDVDYNLFNIGLMRLPFDLPGFAFRKARFAIDRLVDMLAGYVQRSKARMELGEEPSCLIDFWMQETVREAAAAKEAGDGAPLHSDNREIGFHLFDFMFAAQDASPSSLLWSVALLESHPEVLAKVREEVAGIWSPESDKLITGDQLREMNYTEAVAREVVRFRPPAMVLPHIALADFPLTEDYIIPKGTIVFPSIFESSFQGFTEPDRFDPDRFSKLRQEDRLYKRNFLAFGAGTHQCVGQRYALNQLKLFIAMFASLIDFKRHRTDGCDDLMYVPTICPKDGCKVFLSQRCARFPSPTISSAFSSEC